MLKASARKMKEIDIKKSLVVFAALAVSIVVASTAQAITAPTTGSFAYDLYDIGVNEMLKGPAGFIGGLLGIVVSASKLSQNWLWASLGVLGSTCVIKADTITTSLGALLF